jgi:hypothetical protein
MRRILHALLASCILSSCTRDRGVPDAAIASDSIAPAASGAETFYRYGLTGVGTTRAELASALGDPDSTTSRAVKNVHDQTQTDSVLVVHYPGLAMEIYRVSANGNELTSSVRVTDNRFIQETAPVRIGMSQTDLLSLMGPATESGAGVLSYACTTCTQLGNERVDVMVANGRVSAVTIFYSID